MQYFPSKFPAGRMPDRTYFFNIMNTVMGDYVSQIIKHAQKVRATKAHNAEAAETIEITDDWYEKLSAIPFISCKLSCQSNLLQSARETLFIC